MKFTRTERNKVRWNTEYSIAEFKSSFCKVVRINDSSNSSSSWLLSYWKVPKSNLASFDLRLVANLHLNILWRPIWISFFVSESISQQMLADRTLHPTLILANGTCTRKKKATAEMFWIERICLLYSLSSKCLQSLSKNKLNFAYI